MNIKKCFFLLMFFMLQSYTQFITAQIDQNEDDSSVIAEEDISVQQIQEQAAMLTFFNVATTSANEQSIEKIYGSSGLNIADTDLENIKKTYCYLEFLIKINKVKTDTSLAQYTSDFKDFLEPDPNNMPLKPTETLVNSRGWQEIQVSSLEIVNSSAWQHFIKAMICDIIDNESEFITNMKDISNQLFIYIPNIEQAYNDDSFTKIRLYEESIQLQSLIQSEQKQRYINQCNDWKNLNIEKLLDGITQFKKTDFYKYTHSAQATESKINQKTGIVDPVIIPSPTREHILCYYMLLHIQTTIQDLMDSTNIKSIIKQTSSDLLTPNFLLYKTSDVVYLSDLFTLQDLRDQNKAHPVESVLKMNMLVDNKDKNDVNNNVVIQAKNNNSNKNKSINDPSNKNPAQVAESIFEQLPITSIYENKLEKTYGMSGLNIDSTQLANIKKTYCYLEYLVKIDKIKNNKNFSHYKETDFKDFMQPSATTIKMPTKSLVASQGWEQVYVTEQELMASSAWQNFIKSMICDCSDNQTDFIINNGEISHQMISYIPNIETAYPKKDFTQMRLYEESTRLHTFMQEDQKKRYLEQCIDWKNFNITQLDSAIHTFKKSDFYSASHTLPKPEDKKNPIPLIIGQQVMSYFLLITIQEEIYEVLTVDNVFNFLKKADSTTFSANFFTYSVNDFVYLYDFLTLKTLIKNNNKAPDDTDPMIATDVKSSQDNVTIQGAGDIFKKKTWNPSKNGTNKAFKSFNNKNAMKGLNKINKSMESAAKKMVTGIMKFSYAMTNAFIEFSAGTIYAGCAFAAIFPGTHINPRAEQARCRKKMNKHKALMATVIGITFVACVAFIVPQSTAILFAAAVAYDTRISEPVMEATEVLMSPILQGMEILTDSMTTGFIEMSVGLTWCSYSFAKLFDPSINVEEQMNRVRAKLEKNRMMLNIIMSVVIVIIVTTIFIVCTGGAAAPGVVAADTAVVGGAAAGTGAAAGAGAAASAGAAAGAGAGAAAGTAAATNAAATTFSLVALFTNIGFIIGQAINIGFGVFDAMAAKYQDDAAARAAKQEKESVQALWKFVESSKVSAVQSQSLFMDELHKKHQAVVANQTFGLQYYENFLNSSVRMVQSQISQALAQQYAQILTPNSNGLRIADIGSSWGLETPFTYLYPSQGFISTTLGRPEFPYAQEIAQAPLASKSQSDKPIDLSDKQLNTAKLWFKQRAISTLKQPADRPLNVEIRFRILYSLTTSYHVGLYLGGNHHDYESAQYLKSIEDTNSIDLNEAHLAKMFVLKRDDVKAMPSLGLYENEGKGWITQKPLNSGIINTASVYHMSAKLDKDQLTVGFWPEDNPSVKWTKTTTVSPCDQRTFGVIFSGVAIEWGMVKPNQPIMQNKKIRSKSNGQSEADRERASKKKWKQIMNPKFGSMKMKSFGRPAILQGKYLYTTESTGLADNQGNPATDYIVFAITSDNQVTNLGASPAPTDTTKTPNGVVSLITGNVYNNSGKIITHAQNALNIYTQNSTSISQSLGESIAQSAQEYQQQLLQFSFGSYQLTSLGQDAINAGLFIYTCPTTITTTDSLGNPIIDYLIMADLINDSLGSTVGMPPSGTIPGMISLITGNVYNKKQIAPIDGGYSQLNQYITQYGQLPPEITEAINNSLNSYNNVVFSEEPIIKESPVNVIGSQTMSFTDLMQTLPPITGGFEFGLSSGAPSNIITTDSTISKLQASAAGNAKVELNYKKTTQSKLHTAKSIPTVQAILVGAQTANKTNKQKITPLPLPQIKPDNTAKITATPDGKREHVDKQQVPTTALPPTATQPINQNTFELAGSSGFSF